MLLLLLLLLLLWLLLWLGGLRLRRHLQHRLRHSRLHLCLGRLVWRRLGGLVPAGPGWRLHRGNHLVQMAVCSCNLGGVALGLLRLALWRPISSPRLLLLQLLQLLLLLLLLLL